ncbi:MAG TPA: histidine phosphatase family protein [Chitinophagaceae bacterium]
MLKRGLFFFLLFISLTATSQTYYIVRHAEKAAVDGNPNMNASNPPLSDAGKQRAEALKDALKGKHISQVFSTDLIRTRTTAGPLAELLNLPINTYKPMSFDAFAPGAAIREDSIKILVVGHSNTVDDIVNFLCKEQKLTDLADSEYDNLFIVTIKNGVATFERKKYGAPSH